MGFFKLLKKKKKSLDHGERTECSERILSRNAALMEKSQATNLPSGPVLHRPTEELEVWRWLHVRNIKPEGESANRM